MSQGQEEMTTAVQTEKRTLQLAGLLLTIIVALMAFSALRAALCTVKALSQFAFRMVLAVAGLGVVVLSLQQQSRHLCAVRRPILITFWRTKAHATPTATDRFRSAIT